MEQTVFKCVHFVVVISTASCIHRQRDFSEYEVFLRFIQSDFNSEIVIKQPTVKMEDYKKSGVVKHWFQTQADQ